MSKLVGFLPIGFPTVDRAQLAFDVMLKNGVDIVEIGVPYSDPVMDGAEIQAADIVALKNGISLKDAIPIVDLVNSYDKQAYLMTYWNLVWTYGLDKFANDFQNATGTILPDLPYDMGLDNSNNYIETLKNAKIGNTYLIAPNSADDRIKAMGNLVKAGYENGAEGGFLYITTTLGVTGERESSGNTAEKSLNHVRSIVGNDIPLYVGIGISTPEQVHDAAKFADGVIVGSALVRALKNDETSDLSEFGEFVKKLADAAHK
ncbi:MAG: tryptophan synthase subunit alpha [Bifidobacteriaceae bacterium]|jgi:tryptophan synthase alpha chain|nr:tryptophan synthase subunit alpha [Bifidobacteriaceae bacterium]